MACTRPKTGAPRTRPGTVWDIDRIEYAQWLSYCGVPFATLLRSLHCSPGVLRRHLRIDVAALKKAARARR